MKGKYLKKIGGLVLAALMLSGVAFVSAGTVEAQGRGRGRGRVVVVRQYRPFGFRSRWGYPYDPWGYNRYDPWSPYGSAYRQYVFSSTDSAANHGYDQGFKTGKDDGKKAKSFSAERSHYFQEAGFGNFGEAYRSGFSRGYQEGYRVGSNERAS
jgi:hypothetical protein